VLFFEVCVFLEAEVFILEVSILILEVSIPIFEVSVPIFEVSLLIAPPVEPELIDDVSFILEDVSVATEVESVVEVESPFPQAVNAPITKTNNNFFIFIYLMVYSDKYNKVKKVTPHKKIIIELCSKKIKPSLRIRTASNDCLPYENLY